ncbi:MAG: response regulator [Flavobacteriia bacterium]|nr:response regulator [Flavobacteriia bacterium]
MKKVDVACIIDDDPIFVFGARKVMELANFAKSFMIYHNGLDAIQALEPILRSDKGAPDVILVDLNMPVMDGWQFLDRLVTIPITQKITVYIVTSSIDSTDIDKAKEYEIVSDYVVKPITKEKLKDMINE